MRFFNCMLCRYKVPKLPKKQAVSLSGLKLVPIEAFAPKLRESIDKFVVSLESILVNPLSRCLCRTQALDLQSVQLSWVGEADQSAESMQTPSEPQQNIPPLVLGDNSPPHPSHTLSHSHDQSEMPASANAIKEPNTRYSKRKSSALFQSTGPQRSSKKCKTSSDGSADPEVTPPPMPMPTSRPNTESKPLKPLVAFMDQFLENLRSVGMHAESVAPQQTGKAVGRPSSRRKSSNRNRISGEMTLLGLTFLGSSWIWTISELMF
jgi:hypothetical protein